MDHCKTGMGPPLITPGHIWHWHLTSPSLFIFSVGADTSGTSCHQMSIMNLNTQLIKNTFINIITFLRPIYNRFINVNMIFSFTDDKAVKTQYICKAVNRESFTIEIANNMVRRNSGSIWIHYDLAASISWETHARSYAAIMVMISMDLSLLSFISTRTIHSAQST